MEPWTPRALKYRRVLKSQAGDGPNEGDGDGPSEGHCPRSASRSASSSALACLICGVYQGVSGRPRESCPIKLGQPCQFVTDGQKGDDDTQQGKQKGKGNSDEQKGKDKLSILSQDEISLLSRLPSWLHDKRYTDDITEADVVAADLLTYKGKNKSKGKSGDSSTGKGKSGDSLTGKGKSKSGGSFDPDTSSPRSQASALQEQDESPARPLRRWASGVMTSPTYTTIPPTPEDPLLSPHTPEDPLEATDPNNSHEVPGPQENPPAEGNPHED